MMLPSRKESQLGMANLVRRAGALVLTVTVTAMVSGGKSLAQEKPMASSSITFNTIDVFGNILPYRVVGFLSLESKQEFASKFTGLRAEMIPQGRYSYKLYRSDHPNIGQFEGILDVNRSDTWKTLVYHGIFRVVEGRTSEALQAPPKGFVVHGSVRLGAMPDLPLWLRVVDIYGDRVYETSVDEHREFRIEEFLRGNFIILLFGGGRLIHVQRVTFRPLSSNPGPLVLDVARPLPAATVIEGKSQSLALRRN